MPRFTAAELIAALSPVATDGVGSDLLVNSVSTDTRQLERGALFVALRGERYDAHQFVHHAIERGAAALVLEHAYREQLDTQGVPTFWVSDTLVALGNIARAHRRRFAIPVVAVAGSVGKTTTKDIAAHLLSRRYRVHKTFGNWNNRVGVPLVLLQLTEQHTAAVVELGTNHPGEIAELVRITEPTHGIITAIAKEHLEFFGTLDGVEREETALFGWLAEHGGVACVNVDDERLRRYQLPCALRFGCCSDAELRATVRFEADTLYPILSLQWNGEQMESRLRIPGVAAARCGIAAAAVALSVGLTLAEIADGIESYQPEPPHGYARMHVQQTATGIVVLNDCYNANPASMHAALETLAAYPTRGRRIAVLGDMRELGAATDSEHRELLAYACRCADIVVVMGEAFHRAAAHGAPNTVVRAASHSDAARAVLTVAQRGDVVLVKGSRSLELERVIALIDAAAPPEVP